MSHTPRNHLVTDNINTTNKTYILCYNHKRYGLKASKCYMPDICPMSSTQSNHLNTDGYNSIPVSYNNNITTDSYNVNNITDAYTDNNITDGYTIYASKWSLSERNW